MTTRSKEEEDRRGPPKCFLFSCGVCLSLCLSLLLLCVHIAGLGRRREGGREGKVVPPVLFFSSLPLYFFRPPLLPTRPYLFLSLLSFCTLSLIGRPPVAVAAAVAIACCSLSPSLRPSPPSTCLHSHPPFPPSLPPSLPPPSHPHAKKSTESATPFSLPLSLPPSTLRGGAVPIGGGGGAAAALAVAR